MGTIPVQCDLFAVQEAGWEPGYQSWPLYSLHIRLPRAQKQEPLLWVGVYVLSGLAGSNSFATPRAVTCQVPLSMAFSRQEYYSWLPFPSPGDLPNPGIEPTFPARASGFFTTEPLGSPLLWIGFAKGGPKSPTIPSPPVPEFKPVPSLADTCLRAWGALTVGASHAFCFPFPLPLIELVSEMSQGLSILNPCWQYEGSCHSKPWWLRW